MTSEEVLNLRNQVQILENMHKKGDIEKDTLHQLLLGVAHQFLTESHLSEALRVLKLIPSDFFINVYPELARQSQIMLDMGEQMADLIEEAGITKEEVNITNNNNDL